MGGQCKPYRKVWRNMMRRLEYASSRNEAYRDVSVCAEWMDSEKFREWFESYQYKADGWQLDKDLLSNGDKEYSPETCCFLPEQLNRCLMSTRKDSGGSPGVTHKASRGTYEVTVKNMGKYIFVGSFRCKKEALSAYMAKKREIAIQLFSEFKDLLDPRAIEAIKTFNFGVGHE